MIQLPSYCTFDKIKNKFTLSGVQYMTIYDTTRQRTHKRWESTDLIAWTTTTLNSSGISDMNDVICFIRRSTLLSLPVCITHTDAQWQQHHQHLIHNVSQWMLQLYTSLHCHLTKSSRFQRKDSGRWLPCLCKPIPYQLACKSQEHKQEVPAAQQERNIICIVKICEWTLLTGDAIHSPSTMLSTNLSLPGWIYDTLDFFGHTHCMVVKHSIC